MPDFEYVLGPLSQAARYRATRHAIFYGLFPHVQRPDLEVEDLVARVYVLWRGLLKRLRADFLDNGNGYAKVGPPLAYQYMRNCPPPGVGASTPAKCCGVSLVCPWCFARRRVLEPFKRFEAALWDEENELRGPCRLLEFSRRMVVWDKIEKSYPRKEYDPVVHFRDSVRWLVDSVVERRREEIDEIPNLGGYVLHKFDVNRAGEPCLYRAGILIVPADCPTEFDFKGSASYRVHDPTRDNLARAFARICRFPARLYKLELLRLVMLLNLTRGFRFDASYGVLRCTKGQGDYWEQANGP